VESVSGANGKATREFYNNAEEGSWVSWNVSRLRPANGLGNGFGGGDDGANFGVGKDPGGVFGGFEDAVNDGIGFGDAVAREPVHHVGFAAHGADFHDLFEADNVRRDATVDGVGEIAILRAHGFDNGRGVDAGGGAEGVFAEHRIVRRDSCVCSLGNFFAINAELGEIVVAKPHEAKIDK